VTRQVEYTDERPYELHRRRRLPMIPARIAFPDSDISIRRLMLVDSGADQCLVPFLVLEALEIPRERLRPAVTTSAAGSADALEVDLVIDVGGVSAVAPTIVAPSRQSDIYILGREPFFRLLHFGFAQYEDPTRNLLLWRAGPA
jgi:hypothetical protein